MSNSIDSYKLTVKNLVQSYSFNKPQDILRQKAQQVDEFSRRIEQSVKHYFGLLIQQSNSLSLRIHSLNPKLALKRGYTITRQNGRIAGSVKNIVVNNAAEIEFSDGVAKVLVKQK